MGVSAYYAIGYKNDLNKLISLTTEEKWRITLAMTFGVNDRDGNMLFQMAKFNHELELIAKMKFQSFSSLEYIFLPTEDSIDSRFFLNVNMYEEIPIRWQPENSNMVSLACYGIQMEHFDVKHGRKQNVTKCNKMIGFRNSAMESVSETYALYELYDGSYRVYGFRDKINMYDISGSGYKYIEGGNDGDIFVLRNDEISGLFDGKGGLNVLDLEAYHLNESLEMDFTKIINDISLFDTIKILNITNVIGAKHRAETIICSCELSTVSTQGGTINLYDQIFVPASDCFYNHTTIDIHEFVNVTVKAQTGLFVYKIHNFRGKAILNFLNTGIRVDHMIFYNISTGNLRIKNVESVDLEYNFYNVIFEILDDNENSDDDREAIGELYVYNITNRTLVTNNENATITFSKDLISLVFSREEDSEKLKQSANLFSNQLKAFTIAYSPSIEMYVVVASDYLIDTDLSRYTKAWDVDLSNNPEKVTHLYGGSASNEFIVLPKLTSEFMKIEDVFIYLKNGSENILNLGIWCILVKSMDHSSRCIVERMMTNNLETDKDIRLMLSAENILNQKHTVGTVTIINDNLDLDNLIIQMRSNMEFDIGNSSLLVPSDIEINETAEFVEITELDIEPNTTLLVSHYLAYLFPASTDIALHIHCIIGDLHWVTLTFYDFFESIDLPTLNIKFKNYFVSLSQYKINKPSILNVSAMHEALNNVKLLDKWNESEREHYLDVDTSYIPNEHY